MRRGLMVAAGSTAAMVATTLGVTAGPAETLEPRPGASARPNVVLVVMDDMRLDDTPWMPRTLRQVGNRGTVYDNYYAPTALCCPTRASILRGQYPHNTGVLTNAEPDGGYAGFRPLDGSTLATWLQPTYTTGYVGKYFNGYEGSGQTYVPPGWDDWMGTISTYGYRSIMTNQNGTIIGHGRRNSPQVFADEASTFVTRNAGRAQPFFLHLSFVTPHNGGPHNDGDNGISSPYVPRRDRDTYRGPAHATDASYNEADMSDKTGPDADRELLSPRDKRHIEVAMQQRRESLASADRAVARVMTALRETGQLSNTYVIFTSDNGFVLGEHRDAKGKRSPYEVGSHLPLYIRGPGVPVGHTWTSPAGTQDIAPTILDIADASADIALDGTSVLPGPTMLDGERDRGLLLEGADLPVDAENGGAIRYAAPRTVAETRWLYHGVVTRNWKLIEWDQLGTYELYDLRSDPYEVDSVAGDPRYAERLQEMIRRLQSLRSCTGAECD